MQAASQVLVRPGYRPRTLAKIAHRINVTNLNIARKIVRSWGLHKKEDVTVVEAYPGVRAIHLPIFGYLVEADGRIVVNGGSRRNYVMDCRKWNSH